MRRAAVIGLVVAAVLLTLGAGEAWAAWPQFPLAKPDFRGPGFYLSWIKILACSLLFMLWVKTTDWASIDCQDLKLDYQRWNSIVFGAFFGAFVLVWLIPIFWVAFPLLVVAYVAPLTAYIVHRNSKVDNDQRVLTPEHLRFLTATGLNKLGFKMDVERRDPHESGPPVKVFAQGGPDERTDAARLIVARQSPGLTAAREVLYECLAGRATAVMLDYGAQGAAMRTLVDGVWIPRETRSRESADPALESLKLLCGLNPQDRQSRQQGTFGVEYEKSRPAATLTSQGIPTGERVLIQFETKKVKFKKLDDIGMRAKLQEELRQALDAPQGFVLLSAPPGGGLRSTTDVALNSCDRLTREFAAVEEESNRYEEIENIPVTTYKAADGQSPTDVLPKFFRTEPQVAVIRDLIDADTVSLMCEEIADGRLMISTVRANDCAEALLRVLALGVPAEEFAKAVTLVVCQRLVRKLCDACKEAYAPTPQVLQQLGIPEGRVQAFYRPFQPNPEEPKEPCQVCGAIGYCGRTAIFEMLTVGDAVRAALMSNPRLEAVRQAARKDGMKSLREEGVLLVAKGVTSLPELMRVLK
ncbi:MAG: Flp pilus assembly complex ATPase component TadA [Planctomycetaceae bacterium]|nr:Flp pilus assembly complex ATPase component TadA [Planctomycetaceae bacterium]